MVATLFPGISHLQNIHPLVVHFPIAFLIGSVVFYLLSLATRKDTLANTAFVLLITGTLTAAAAVGTGLYAESGVMVSHTVREQLLSVHEKCMIATLTLSAALSLWAVADRPFPRKGRAIFLRYSCWCWRSWRWARTMAPEWYTIITPAEVPALSPLILRNKAVRRATRSLR